MRTLKPLFVAGGVAIALAVGGAASLGLASAPSEVTALATTVPNVSSVAPGTTSTPAPSSSAPAPAPAPQPPAAAPAPVPLPADAPATTGGKVSEIQAVQWALSRSPGYVVDRIEMDMEDEGLVWKVRLEAGDAEVEYRILVNTGAVVRVKIDDDDRDFDSNDSSGHRDDDSDRDDDSGHGGDDSDDDD